MASILIVEDDKHINDMIAKNLRVVGHSCKQAYDGIAGLHTASEETFDLILLDIMLPGLSGFDLANEISDTPVIFITAKDSVQDKVAGFRHGADDYIVKPFEMLELIERVNAVLRRTMKIDNTFAFQNVTVDFLSHKITKNNVSVETTHQEFQLLEVLITNRNIALSREKLLTLAWGYDYLGDTRTVDNHIQKLRMKLGWENVIKTVYKLGYRLET